MFDGEPPYRCPRDGCGFESTEKGVKLHHAKSHGESLNYITLDCDWCGKSFERVRTEYERYDNHFCSNDCRYEWTEAENGHWDDSHYVTRECDWCETQFERIKSWDELNERSFCGYDCANQWMNANWQGEDAPQWEGGYRHNQFRGRDWTERRQQVLERDDYECQSCGMDDADHIEEVGCSLDIHHIVPQREFDDPENAHALDNLVALCKSCHQSHEYADTTDVVSIVK